MAIIRLIIQNFLLQL